MAGYIIETPDSRTFEQTRDRKSAVWRLKAFECEDNPPLDASMEAYNLAVGVLPSTYADMVLESISAPQAQGLGSFIIEARYSSIAPQSSTTSSVGSPTTDLPAPAQPAAGSNPNALLPVGFSFQIGTVDEHITKSLKTIDEIPDPSLLPVVKSFWKAIGVGANGQVTGCNRPRPTANFSIPVKVSGVTAGKYHFWEESSGKANSVSWGIWKARMLIFRGVTGDLDALGSGSLNFNFEYCPPKVAKTAALDTAIGNIEVPAIDGTDYEWVYYDVDPQGRLVPFQVNIERTLEELDFRKLGIGVGPGGTVTGV